MYNARKTTVGAYCEGQRLLFPVHKIDFNPGFWYSAYMDAVYAQPETRASENIGATIILVRDDRGLQPVFGIPAIRRMILLVRKMAAAPVFVVGQVEAIQNAISDLLLPEAFHPLQDPAQLSRIFDRISVPAEGPILVLGADQVIDFYSLRLLTERWREPGPVFMKSSENPGGIWLTDRQDLAPLLRRLWPKASGSAIESAKGTRIKGAPGMPHALQPGPGAGAVAEKRLTAALFCQTKADDGFIARHFDRRISAFISTRIARTRVSPNQITLYGAALGLAGAVLLSRPGYRPQLIGALLFLLAVVIDGVDGEVARLKLMESRFGHFLDVMMDNVVHLAVFIGMAVGLYGKTANPVYLHLLWVLLAGFGLCALAVNRYVLKKSPADLQRSPALLRLLALVTNRDFAYLVFLLAVIDRLRWFLVGATAGVYLFAAALWALNLYQKRMAAAKVP